MAQVAGSGTAELTATLSISNALVPEVSRNDEKAPTSVPLSRKFTTGFVLGSDWLPFAGTKTLLPPNDASTLFDLESCH
jgi:hypothetical protein